METFVTSLHILVALVLIILVLVQDSKSGGMGGAFGGGGSNSVLGATGAASLAQRLTRWTAVVFAFTCISLTMYSARPNKSVVDSVAPLSTEAAPDVPAPQAPGTEAAPPSEAPAPANK